MTNEGKKKRKAPVKAALKAAAKGEGSPVKVPKPKIAKPKKDPMDMTLAERLALKSKESFIPSNFENLVLGYKRVYQKP